MFLCSYLSPFLYSFLPPSIHSCLPPSIHLLFISVSPSVHSLSLSLSLSLSSSLSLAASISLSPPSPYSIHLSSVRSKMTLCGRRNVNIQKQTNSLPVHPYIPSSPPPPPPPSLTAIHLDLSPTSKYNNVHSKWGEDCARMLANATDLRGTRLSIWPCFH